MADIIFLRLFAEVDGVEEAGDVCNSVERILAGYGKPVAHNLPRPYWKIPAYYELAITLHPLLPVAEAFEEVLRKLGTGWQTHRFSDGGDWAVWNAGEERNFAISEVRWANVECMST